jgi:hypothetical protein
MVAGKNPAVILIACPLIFRNLQNEPILSTTFGFCQISFVTENKDKP